MTRAQRHRGPDDEGMYLLPGGQGGLGNNRLAIRDLSPAGHMPMGNADGTVWITFNGEIYNTDEIQPQLEALGYDFRSEGDTEVILHGYEAWGEGVVEKLRGIFAFGILDVRPQAGNGVLLLARDHLGVKPLYYASTPDGFVFASELKGLQASGMVGRAVSPAGLVGYLMMGSVPGPLTIYRDVYALEAGSTLTITLDLQTAPDPRRYWSLPTDTEDVGDDDRMAERVRALLQDAVKRQLVSDVPLGAFLSGGLDSSAVVALMRRATAGPIRTCSMVFEEQEYSEAPYARAMAEAVGAEHYERVVTAEDVTRQLDRIFWAMDQPTIDGVNTYFVSQTAREAGLTVALSGLGGDELFGGYAITFDGVPRMMRALTAVQRTPGGRALARRAIGRLPARDRLARVQDALDRDVSPASAYLTRRGLFSYAQVRDLLAPDVWQEGISAFDPVRYVAERADAPVPQKNGALFAWSSRAELSTYTRSQLLRDTDVMSMCHSLEVRVPLLDHRLVETTLRLPAQLQHRPGGAKSLLRTSVSDALPTIVRDQREKQGFVFPFDDWLKEWQDGLRGPVSSSSPTAVALRPEAIADLTQRHRAGKVHWSRPWALIVLERWMQGHERSL